MRTLFLALTLTPNAYAFDVPEADGFVTDIAGVLSANEERSLEIDLQNYKGETSNEIAILIINTLDGEVIADTAVEVGREWGVGSAENDNGLLLLIAIEDRKIFIAVGYGLEGAVPDLAAKQIIDREITPEFKSGNYSGGITAGVAALKSQIGGEYEVSSTSISENLDGVPTPLWMILSVFGLFFFFMFYQFFIGVLLTISPSRSWWEGGFLGGMFGFFFGGITGLIVLGAAGALTDFLASMLYLKHKPFREFLKKQKKKKKSGEGIWVIGGGGRGGSSGGGGGFGGGGFGGGGAGGSW